MISLEEVLASELVGGQEVIFKDCSKRMDGPEGRDWYSRITWTVYDVHGRMIRECALEGFASPSEALLDFMEKANKL